jgi:hypothetical protein
MWALLRLPRFRRSCLRTTRYLFSVESFHVAVETVPSQDAVSGLVASTGGSEESGVGLRVIVAVRLVCGSNKETLERTLLEVRLRGRVIDRRKIGAVEF